LSQPPPYTLFEVSWEVCNKVGGIHTVVSTKARTLVERLGDAYVCVGPWLLNNPESDRSFEESPGFGEFADSCRALGVPVRVGRWRIPSSPRAVLIEFSGLFEKKDELLKTLWEDFKVDSITGGWDYHEPVVFGHAAGLVIQRWYEEYVAPLRGVAVAQFHEWMAAAGQLALKRRVPAAGTIFTTHATMLGRALSSTGALPEAGLAGRTPDAAADAIGVRSKHSMEKVCAREADVFTTVSELTAGEAERFFGRRPAPVLPNGIDLEVIDELRGGVERGDARAALANLARRILAEPLEDAVFLMLSGRYEFHNKGIDLLLEAVAQLRDRPGKPLVLFLTVPAGQSGICREVQARLAAPSDVQDHPFGSATHNLNDGDADPIQTACRRLGLDNARGSRVKVLQIPIYLSSIDGLLNLPYEAVLAAVDLSVFPSFYEPWGYTPEESLAVGVPTVTTDLAGFGRWAQTEGLGPADGVHVLHRKGVPDAEAAKALAALIERFAAEQAGDPSLYEICRRTAQRTAWSDLIANYDQAFERAAAAARERFAKAPPLAARPSTPMQVAPQAESRRPRLFNFEVSATLPAALAGLQRLSRNFYWCWDAEGRELFEELAPRRWDASGHNPVQLLRMVYPEDLEERAQDPHYLEKLARVLARFEAYLAEGPSAIALEGGGSLSPERPVAYFCAEFGLQEALAIYSGGLGVLAGDHLKAASDLRLPLVGVGLFYRKGYLVQKVTAAGDQIARDHVNDPHHLALELVRDARGEPLEVALPMPSSTLYLRAWRADVGRVPLYLLDADVEKNRPEDRAITAELYGGDQETRLRQEIALGRGGARLLAALGIKPAAWHINEGHAAFMALERVGALVRDEALTFDEARELVRSSTAFTTHTPVPAGHDRFPEDLIRRYFSDIPSWMGVSWERFIGLGRSESEREQFNLTLLALQFSGFVNGVSKMHGEVSKALLSTFWPGALLSEVPVGSVTNGVHLPTWTHPALLDLFGVSDRPVRGSDFAERAPGLDLGDLWRMRRVARSAFLTEARRNLQRGFIERHDRPLLLQRVLDGLEEEALLIGFARRFAPYKRAALLFKDGERLKALLSDTDRPLRIFFAGKAHPRDELGKQVLKHVVELCRSPDFAGKVFFLEDYDMDLARRLVQGVDVWLNNPIRGLEASGTSGMKAAANGVLNLSVADGWWPEGRDGENGWSIGDGREYPDESQQDELDSAHLCRLLEEEVLPLYFERDALGVPRRWLERCRKSLATIPPVFSTERMVAEYRDAAYAPLAARRARFEQGEHVELKRAVAERARVARGFADVQIAAARVSELSALRVGQRVEGRVEVDLGPLSEADVLVELVLGHAREGGDLFNPQVLRLAPVGRGEGSTSAFEGGHVLTRSGSFAYGVRVRPRGPDGQPIATDGLVRWA
jgi:phosphorylase/glycogen(starch) synthase